TLTLTLTLALAHAHAHSGKVVPQFDHKKLKVYQASLEFVTWATDLLSTLEPKAAVKDQLDRAPTTVPLNIAEGNGKFVIRACCLFLDFARGSALESQRAWTFWLQTVLIDVAAVVSGKQHLFEIASLLMGLINSLSSKVREDQGNYSFSEE